MIWVRLCVCREEAHAPPAAVSLISSPAWAITFPAATPAIHVTAVSLKPSVIAVAWTTPAKINMDRTKFYPEMANGGLTFTVYAAIEFINMWIVQTCILTLSTETFVNIDQT